MEHDGDGFDIGDIALIFQAADEHPENPHLQQEARNALRQLGRRGSVAHEDIGDVAAELVGVQNDDQSDYKRNVIYPVHQ